MFFLRAPPQGSSQQRQSATQAPGPAGHGAAAQAVALQAPGQPLPHQDREDPAGSRLANDAGPGESSLWWPPSHWDKMKLIKKRWEKEPRVYAGMSVIREGKSGICSLWLSCCLIRFEKLDFWRAFAIKTLCAESVFTSWAVYFTALVQWWLVLFLPSSKCCSWQVCSWLMTL